MYPLLEFGVSQKSKHSLFPSRCLAPVNSGTYNSLYPAIDTLNVRTNTTPQLAPTSSVSPISPVNLIAKNRVNLIIYSLYQEVFIGSNATTFCVATDHLTSYHSESLFKPERLGDVSLADKLYFPMHIALVNYSVVALKSLSSGVFGRS